MWNISAPNGDFQLEGSTPDLSVRFLSSGRLFCIKGRSKHFYNGVLMKESPFDICLDNAKIKEMQENSIDVSNKDFKNVLHGQTEITIKATDFDKSLSPISALSLTFIMGKYDTDNVGYRPILLCKGRVEMFTGQPYVPGQKDIRSSGEIVEHVIDKIILLTAQVGLKETIAGIIRQENDAQNVECEIYDAKSKGKGLQKYKEEEQIKITREYNEHIPSMMIKFLKIFLILIILITPMSLNFFGYFPMKDIIMKSIYHYQFSLATNMISYFLRGLQILFLVLLFLVYIATPLRWDFLQDIPYYFNIYFRSTLSLSDEFSEIDSKQLSFFVHSWNAWGFCGAVKQGHVIPMYSMPHVCVKAFHSGGPALNINFGCGTDVRNVRSKKEKEMIMKGCEKEFFSSDKRDYVASDMFAILSNVKAKNGIICGFLSQKEQFGCIALNKSYDHMSVHIDCDGAVFNPDNLNINKDISTSNKIEKNLVGCQKVNRSDSHSCEVLQTDWFFIQLQDRLDEDPLGSYLELSGRYNNVHELYASKETNSNINDKNKNSNNDNNHNNDNNSNSNNMKKKSNNKINNNDNDGHKTKVNIVTKIDNNNDSLLDESLVHTKNILSPQQNKMKEEISYTKTEIDINGSISSISVRVESVSTVKHRVPAGWCSWYHFFEFVSEKDLTDNIDNMHLLKTERGMHTERIGFNLFQVDDGYQTAWGDWLLLHSIRFPSQSMNVIVDKIKAASMTPGLWMAPFACDLHSKLGKDHPDWILKRRNLFLDFSTKKGNIIPANSANCGKWFYGLDVTNPEVQEHIKECITTATMNWGYEYLKLDFLYAAALNDSHGSYYNQKITRAQAMQIGLKIISNSMGKNVFLLGCGAPIGSVLGNVHANRVSSDAGLSWYPDFPLPYYDKWNLPCARNMVRNSINRMVMHGRWWINDPDCILLRTTTNYNNNEIIGIATIKAMSGGSFIISDDLNAVPLERMRFAQQLLPATNIAGVPLDLLDKECPEIIRLQMGKNRSQGGGITMYTGSNILSCLNNWTIVADCNWGERKKSNYITPNYLDLLSKRNISHNTRNDLKKKKRTYSDVQVLHILEFWSSEYSYRYLNVRDVQERNLVSDTNDNTNNKTYKDDNKNIINSKIMSMDENIEFGDVDPHSAKIYVLRLTQFYDLKPSYIGSNLHFTCGLEVKNFIFQLSTDAEDGDPEKNNKTNKDKNIFKTNLLSKSGFKTSKFQNSCSITFEHSAVRCEKWVGYFWIFLPTKIDPNKNENSNKKESENENLLDYEKYLRISGSLVTIEKPKLMKFINYPAVVIKGGTEKEEKEIGLGCVWRIAVASKANKIINKDEIQGTDNKNYKIDINDEDDNIHIYW